MLSLSVEGKAASLLVIMLLLLLLVTETGLTFSVSSVWLVFSILSSNQVKKAQEINSINAYGTPEKFFPASEVQGHRAQYAG